MPAGRRTPTWVLLLAAVVGVVLAVGAAVLIAVGSSGGTEPKTVEIVVPAGTQDRLAAGEQIVVMPSPLRLRVGDTLVIRNDDDVDQSVGPYLVPAQDQMRLTFGSPGVFEGYCPLSAGERYEIVVEEA